MSQAIIYYGAPTSKPTQTVSESLRLKGISLLRAVPSSVMPVGIRYVNSPNYDIYCANLGPAFATARKKVPINLSSDTRFQRDTGKDLLPEMRPSTIVWTYANSVPAPTEDTLNDVKSRYNAAETTIHGKPAFIAILNLTQVSTLLAGTKPCETTPTLAQSLNIAGYKIYIKLCRLAMTFLQVHQYPLCPEFKTDFASFYNNAVKIDVDSVTGTGPDAVRT
jgi:hypothetical protein